MPNIKSNAKRAKTNNKKNEYYSAFKSSVRTAIKNFDKSVEAGNKEEAQANLSLAYKKLDKATSKGVMHKNKAARTKARLTAKYNSL